MFKNKQLVFPLPYRTTFKKEDFLVADCNKEAVMWLDEFPKWPMHGLIVLGEKAAGKTHLANLFSNLIFEASDLPDFPIQIAEKIVIENIDRNPDEVKLFHWYNEIKAQKKFVLMTARELPKWTLKDLDSRIAVLPKVFINNPDENLLFGVLIKAFYERNIRVDPKVLEYAINRVPRTFKAIQEIIQKADKESLIHKRPITIPMLKEIIQNIN